MPTPEMLYFCVGDLCVTLQVGVCCFTSELLPLPLGCFRSTKMCFLLSTRNNQGHFPSPSPSLWSSRILMPKVFFVFVLRLLLGS